MLPRSRTVAACSWNLSSRHACRRRIEAAFLVVNTISNLMYWCFSHAVFALGLHVRCVCILVGVLTGPLFNWTGSCTVCVYWVIFHGSHWWLWVGGTYAWVKWAGHRYVYAWGGRIACGTFGMGGVRYGHGVQAVVLGVVLPRSCKTPSVTI